jgi:DNA-directed RNA polymerase specialized sigma24 family protein
MEGLAYVNAAAPARDDRFIATVGQHYPGLVRRLTAVVGDREAALDLAQEAYLRAYRAWDRFDGTDSRAWLDTIGLRLAFNERDRRRRWSDLLGRRLVSTPWVAPEDLDLHRAAGHRRQLAVARESEDARGVDRCLTTTSTADSTNDSAPTSHASPDPRRTVALPGGILVQRAALMAGGHIIGA